MICGLCGQEIRSSFSYRTFFSSVPPICETCDLQFERVCGGCPCCGRKGSTGICDDCLYWESEGIDVLNTSIFYYNAYAKQVIESIKRHGNLRALESFRMEVKKIGQRKYRGYQWIVPVPLHPKRLEDRGFNQAYRIAQMFPQCTMDCLTKTHHFTQSKRTKEERRQEGNDFKLKEGVDVTGQKIVVIDDIYTTGSTIHHIAKLLYAHGAREVQSFTLFRS